MAMMPTVDAASGETHMEPRTNNVGAPDRDGHDVQRDRELREIDQLQVRLPAMKRHVSRRPGFAQSREGVSIRRVL